MDAQAAPFRLEVWTDNGWYMVDDFPTREDATDSAERTAPGRHASDHQHPARGQWRVRRLSYTFAREAAYGGLCVVRRPDGSRVGMTQTEAGARLMVRNDCRRHGA